MRKLGNREKGEYMVTREQTMRIVLNEVVTEVVRTMTYDVARELSGKVETSDDTTIGLIANGLIQLSLRDFHCGMSPIGIQCFHLLFTDDEIGTLVDTAALGVLTEVVQDIAAVYKGLLVDSEFQVPDSDQPLSRDAVQHLIEAYRHEQVAALIEHPRVSSMVTSIIPDSPG